MSFHIQKFLDRLKVLESKNAREFSCPLSAAQDLHRDITRLLLELDAAKAAIATIEKDQSEVITVELQSTHY